MCIFIVAHLLVLEGRCGGIGYEWCAQISSRGQDTSHVLRNVDQGND